MIISFSVVRELMKRFDEDEVFDLSAELAYFFLLSLFPFLLFLLTFLSYLPIPHEDVIAFLSQYAPSETAHLIETNIKQLMELQSGKWLSFSVLATVWAASNGMSAIIRALNRAYDVKETRSFFVARGVSILFTFAMIFVIIVALVFPVFGKMIGTFLFSAFGLSDVFLRIWETIRWFVSFIILFFVFSVLYVFAPSKYVRFRDVWSGSLFATVGWMVVSLAFSYYVNQFGNYSAMYGSLGGIIALMVWFYLSGMMIVLGGELNAIFCCKREGNMRIR
ncbi:ribonuclease [Anoxybacillus gonensis]|uniref:YihY/virulence factor BrkB family protein n=1 Tax=Anoxybacillus gonensis TaxID=198467 RepID=A0AAW7TKU6_9BACL|nr:MULTISPECIES: YihY/virulence factor BrkB family protein [Anoxybacillus]AKS37312.1 ribonuclease [Anoxybacillus gonensis]EMI11560.1 ribonuclease BN-like family enzyme [Anoxybacillus gonensis]KGP61992.1 ribonuclease [Anoxybacillus gonensis]MCQ5365034.1 YihY/virulence factor BrkB family protein [Anoxybacillus gonensis]MCX8047557.1 YihY/virulence factor BrkB family protein [Anoxybacillus gonensis]